ncbi:MAG TPA: hypothetical protein VL947_10735 [Cytophagales bacterium]|nr:hypothetical protein [Cytophagales bacterium]
MKLKNVLVFLMMSLCVVSYGQGGPDPCPCDPTEGEAAYLACLAAHPECDEDIPVDSHAYILAIAGIFYATYTFLPRKRSLA